MECTCEDARYRRRQCKHQRQCVAGAIPTQWTKTPNPERAAEIAAANDAATDAAEFNKIVRGW